MADEPITPLNEIWKPIPFASGYSISSLGRFRADVRTSRNWLAGPRKVATSINGYQYIRFVHEGLRRKEWVHRVVAKVFIGPPPTPKHEVAHNDGDPTNNKVENLRWATPKENNADKSVHGTHRLGSAVIASKLSDDDVRFIRSCDLSGSELSARLNVSRRTIDRARSGEAWPHIETPPKRRPAHIR